MASSLYNLNKLAKQGGDVTQAVSSLMDQYGGVENFKNAYDSYINEIENAYEENVKSDSKSVGSDKK